jgi:hypothetical protein
MITTQPFFIAGIEDPEEARASAVGAFAMFVFTFVCSGLGIWYDSQNKQEPLESGENGEAEYQLSGTGDFPNYGGTSS